MPRAADRRVVTSLHVRLLELVAEAHARYGDVGLRLEGGTALAAYHLHHRESADLDFFGNLDLNALDFTRQLRAHIRAADLPADLIGAPNQGYARLAVHSATPGDATVVMVDIARSSTFLLEPTELTVEGVRIASYRDLCAGKLHAICDRFEPRDYVDLHVILRRPAGVADTVGDPSGATERFRALVRDVMEVDPGLGIPHIAQAIARGSNRAIVAALPLRILVPLSEDDVQRTIHLCAEECARAVRAELGG
ncbi:MAG: nucleotidyl transferase AbiEii/AbiGii toxin family protein [Gemmatimonadaceae bacterium]